MFCRQVTCFRDTSFYYTVDDAHTPSSTRSVAVLLVAVQPSIGQLTLTLFVPGAAPSEAISERDADLRCANDGSVIDHRDSAISCRRCDGGQSKARAYRHRYMTPRTQPPIALSFSDIHATREQTRSRPCVVFLYELTLTRGGARWTALVLFHLKRQSIMTSVRGPARPIIFGTAHNHGHHHFCI